MYGLHIVHVVFSFASFIALKPSFTFAIYPVIEESLYRGSSQDLPLAPSICADAPMVSQAISTGISKRDDDEDDDLRIRHIEILTAWVPTLEAARSLESFYLNVLYSALSQWANLPPQSHLTIKMGWLELTMDVAFNHGLPRGIPWAFVRNFSRNMLAVTRMEFTGTYDMRYSSVFGVFNPEVGIEVRLRIRWDRL